MAELPFWQLTAGFLAAVLVLVGAVAYIRYPRPVMLVVLGFVIGIPALGWAAYALVPGPVPELGGMLWLAFIPAIGGVGVGVWMLAFMAARRTALTFETIEFLSNGTLVVYGALVLALSDVLALWQPAYAIANVAATVVWLLIWVPASVRRTRLESTVEIRAPVSRVYSFIADPQNWPRYQEDLESVSVRPPGTLAPGSEVVVRQRYETHIRGPQLLPNVIESSSVVTAAVLDRMISMHLANRQQSTSAVEFEDRDGAATRVTTHVNVLAPYRLAVFGGLIELRTQRGERRARAERSLARLKQILEQP